METMHKSISCACACLPAHLECGAYLPFSHRRWKPKQLHSKVERSGCCFTLQVVDVNVARHPLSPTIHFYSRDGEESSRLANAYGLRVLGYRLLNHLSLCDKNCVMWHTITITITKQNNMSNGYKYALQFYDVIAKCCVYIYMLSVDSNKQ